MTKKQPQFLFDTADEQYIRKTWEFLKEHGGFAGTDVVGITSNPNALSKISCNDIETFDRVVPALCKTITEIREGKPGGVIYVQFPQMTMDEQSMRKFVDHIVTLSDGTTKVGLKIPPYTHVLKLVSEFSKKVDTNVTGISDCGTALKCITYGVRYVSILNGRMEEQGVDARKQVRYIRQGNLGSTEIITASMRTVEGLAWVIAEDTVPTIGSRVFDQIIARGADGAKEFRSMWDVVQTEKGEFAQPSEFAPVITPDMTNLSLAFFEQMDALGEPMLKSFLQKNR